MDERNAAFMMALFLFRAFYVYLSVPNSPVLFSFCVFIRKGDLSSHSKYDCMLVVFFAFPTLITLPYLSYVHFSNVLSLYCFFHVMYSMSPFLSCFNVFNCNEEIWDQEGVVTCNKAY